MTRGIWIGLLLLISLRATAQTQGSVSGVLMDTAAHQSLEGAVVRITQVKGTDTVQIASALAQANGQFLLNALPFGSYLLSVTFQGYRHWWGVVTLTVRHPAVTRKVIYLQPSASELGQIVVTDNRPVRIKGDTTEYYADQFHTHPNASLGELMEKMPGIDVLGDRKSVV